MTSLGEIFPRYGPAQRARFGRSLSASQLQAMQAIAVCRSEALGGHVSTCPSGQITRESSHSCRTRHCPTCQQDASQAWLAEQHALLLSVPYFLVTFSLPCELRAIARQQPETIYPLLFGTSAAALQHLAQGPRFLGGQIGMLGVVQTWTRDLRQHPHVHYLVPALALTPDGTRWLVGKRDFLVQVKPLGERVESEVRRGVASDALGGSGQYARLGQVLGRRLLTGRERGERLLYLAPQIFRIALSNNRIEQLANEMVTFRYTEGKTAAQKRATLPLDSLIGRFLAHVLPKGFVTVRSYGLLQKSKRPLLAQVRSILAWRQAAPAQLCAAAALETLVTAPERAVDRCRSCGQPMQLVQTLVPKRQHERLAAMVGEPSSRSPPQPALERVHLEAAFQVRSAQLAIGVPVSSAQFQHWPICASRLLVAARE